MDVGMMVNSDVAVDASALIPKTSRNTGTMIEPPPTPSRPDNTPMNTPSKAEAISRISIAPLYPKQAA